MVIDSWYNWVTPCKEQLLSLITILTYVQCLLICGLGDL